jgi:hypothetical protein
LLAQLLDRRAAFLARLARGNPDLNNLFIGKQAQRAACGKHFAPVEMGAGNGMRRALAEPGGTRCRADCVGSLLDQQWLVTVQRIQGLDALL